MFLAKQRQDHTHHAVNDQSTFGNPHKLDKSAESLREYEEYKNKTEKCWIKLPASVNGTLIYFLLCENNNESIDYVDFGLALFHVGIPVFYTFWLQFLLLYTVWVSVPDFSEDAVICTTDPIVQWAVIGIFMIFLIPSITSILR